MNSFEKAIINFRSKNANYKHTVIVWGSTLKGELNELNFPDIRFIFLEDTFSIGLFNEDIFSEKYVKSRVCSINKICCEKRITNSKYKEKNNIQFDNDSRNEILIIHHNCVNANIWRVIIQAFLESNNIADHISLLKFDGIEWIVPDACVEIDIRGSYESYQKVIMNHQFVELTKYSIPNSFTKAYLDIVECSGKFGSFVFNLPKESLDLCYSDFLKIKKYRYYGLSTDELRYCLIHLENIQKSETLR